MKVTNDLLIEVAERYKQHSNYKSENTFVMEVVKVICEVELDEMWMLTQQRGDDIAGKSIN